VRLAQDRFGLSWQIIPERMGELLSDPDPASPAGDAGDAADAEDRPQGYGGRGERFLIATRSGLIRILEVRPGRGRDG
jgi:hypothetical protein